jgi:hypothetical protein
MSTSEIKPGERVKNVSFTEDALSVDLIDGRTIYSAVGLVSQVAPCHTGTTK